jgi:hypothetical protein
LNKSITAGVLNLVSGAFGVLVFVFFLIMAANIRNIFTIDTIQPPMTQAEYDSFIQIFAGFFSGFAVFFAIVAALCIVGGIQALRQKTWGLVLAGAIAGLFAFLPLGIAAIIFTVKARSEFGPKALITTATPPTAVQPSVPELKHKTAATLIIASSIIGEVMVLIGLYSTRLYSTLPAEGGFSPDFYSGFMGFYQGMAVVYGILGVIGIAAGIRAMSAKNWPFALAGAIISCIAFFPVGIPAVIFIVQAKPEFYRTTPY